MTDILILCTGNSCRSQIAEGLLKSFDPNLHVFSAGTEPSEAVHPFAIQVMAEINIDLSAHKAKSTDLFKSENFDYLITVCDHARETCPFFRGKVKTRLHMGFPDPATASGSDQEILETFRMVRDDMKKAFYDFYLGIRRV